MHDRLWEYNNINIFCISLNYNRMIGKPDENLYGTAKPGPVKWQLACNE